MVKSVEGIYRNGRVELVEPLAEAEGSRVIVTWVHPAESVEIGHNSDDKLNILAKTTNIDNMQRIGHVFARF
jgi:hypothetical protein